MQAHAWLLLSLWALCACDGEAASGELCRALPGDLVISEVMLNPLGDDGDGEWFEIYNASDAPQPVDRLVLVRESIDDNRTVKEAAEHYVRGAGQLASRSYLVIGSGPRDATVDYSTSDGESFGSLNNEQGGIVLRCQGRDVDGVGWGTAATPSAPEEGRSLAFDGGLAPDALLNDAADYWCTGGEPYDAAGNLGTPGARNIDCGLVTCRDGAGSRDVVAPVEGDLVITELLVDPVGSDGKQYWVELYVAADNAVDLNRLTLTTTGDDDVREARVTATDCVSGEPGTYVVVAATQEVQGNGDVNAVAVMEDLRFGQSFVAAGATLTLTREGVLIDAAQLPNIGTASSGRSLQLDGRATQLAQAGDLNDRGAAFCPATDAATGYYAGYGTPGAANEDCGTVVCDDADGLRPVVAPAAGGLVITEIFADPDGSDRNKEWVELYVAGSAADLNGLTLTNTTDANSSQSAQWASTSCLSVAPNEYAVIGFRHVDDANVSVEQGGVVPFASAWVEKDSVLLSAAITLVVSWDGAVIDTAQVPAAVSGVAQTTVAVTGDGNDNLSDFCASAVIGLFDGTGTPGSANFCGATCEEEGALRAVRTPLVGDLVISEVYADPSGADNDREWLELYAGGSAFDLNGLWIDSDTNSSHREWQITSASCVAVDAGAYAVIAGANAATDGVTADASIGTGGLFFNSLMTMQVRSTAGVVDATPSLTPASGKSWQLDATVVTGPEAYTQNDAASAWCAAASAGEGFAGLGTPGAANGTCQ